MKRLLRIICFIFCVCVAGAAFAACSSNAAGNSFSTSPIFGTWVFEFRAGGGIERAGEYVFNENGTYALKTWDNPTGENVANTNGTWKIENGFFSQNGTVTKYTLEFSDDGNTMTWKNATGQFGGQVFRVYTRK